MTDLCTVSDVTNEGGFSDAQSVALVGKIAYKISQLSEEINAHKKSGALALDLKMCCVYGVLTWLERLNLIKNTDRVISKMEGDTSVTYSDPSKHAKSPSSYEEQYQQYLARVIELPPVGMIVGLNASSWTM